jgi:pyruvate/2-oxoglutarate dehydrogenase complex dihydrolipoamide acyltransferase (E2) component
MIDIRVPQDQWDDNKPTSVIMWLYLDGATVKAGEVIAELLVEKATLELLSPGTGTLRIKVQPDTDVSKGTLLGVIE